jgi:DNA-binding NarL/FixJ family response regulator
MVCHIIAIDDHDLFCAGLGLLIEQHLPESEFRSYSSINDAELNVTSRPDAILLDVKLVGQDGIDEIPELRRRWPGSAIILMSSEMDEETVARASAQGVTASLSKSESPERLVSLIRDAIPSIIRDEETRKVRLTHRQIEIVKMMSEGFSNKAIANRLNLSIFTVQVHVQAVFRALGVASRTQAVFEAQRLRLIR